jgi:hydrogenase maturation protease
MNYGPMMASGRIFLMPFQTMSGSLVCINAATRPDLVIEPAVEENPDMVLLIDAAAFDGDPGEIALIPTEAISNYTLSTHTFPMGAIASIISEDADCPVHFIGIQPVTMEMGEGMTEQVQKAADELLELLVEAFAG